MAQNFENHTRTVPGFHFVSLGFSICSVYRVIRSFSAKSVISLLLGVLDENLDNQVIKKMIKNWKPDLLRA